MPGRGPAAVDRADMRTGPWDGRLTEDRTSIPTNVRQGQLMAACDLARVSLAHVPLKCLPVRQVPKPGRTHWSSRCLRATFLDESIPIDVPFLRESRRPAPYRSPLRRQ